MKKVSKNQGFRPKPADKVRRKADEDRKDLLIRVRVTPDQRRVLAAAAEKSGLDISGFLRALGIERARQLGVE